MPPTQGLQHCENLNVIQTKMLHSRKLNKNKKTTIIINTKQSYQIDSKIQSKQIHIKKPHAKITPITQTNKGI